MRIMRIKKKRGLLIIVIVMAVAFASGCQEANQTEKPLQNETTSSITPMGEKAADQIVEAAKDGPFLSKDDFRQRTKCPQTVIDKMSDMGLLGDIPDSNQISLFDLMKGF